MSEVFDQRVARPARTADWNLIRDGKVVAGAHATCRPDGRWFVSIDTWDATADTPLLQTMVDDLRHDLHTNVDGADEPELRRWHALGFEPVRRELLLTIPVDPVVTGLTHAVLPGGIVVLPADAVDETQLRELDDALRADVPGSDGWVNDPMEFRSTHSTNGSSIRRPTWWRSTTPQNGSPDSCASGPTPGGRVLASSG